VLSITANLLLGIYLLTNVSTRPQSDPGAFPFLSKRIFAENQNDILINFTDLRSELHDYIAKQDGKIGVYFEYLPSGTSIGVNDQLAVTIASLIKIPIIMVVYREIEKGNLSRDKTLILQESDLSTLSGDLWKRGVGGKVTVNEAIELSITKSDNTASNILRRSISTEMIDHVFDSLDIPKTREGTLTIITPKSYTSILRSLYLSSYLERESSNEILTIMTKAEFKDLIPSGVPETVPVAHKFGIFELPETPTTLSDCGIVYLPSRPYSLCVMVQGSQAQAFEYIQSISKIVYNYVEKADR
jgi:beta-lactamase class A